MSTSRPYRNFSHAELSTLAGGIAMSKATGTPVVELAENLVLVPRPFVIYPALFKTDIMRYIACSTPSGVAYYDGSEDFADLLNQWTQPYQLLRHEGVWTVTWMGERRSPINQVGYGDCPLVTPLVLDKYNRFHSAIQRYVEKVDLGQLDHSGLALCRGCERRQTNHLLGHIDRGDVSPALVRELAEIDLANMPADTRQRLADALIDLLVPYVIPEPYLLPAITHHAHLARTIGWRYRNA